MNERTIGWENTHHKCGSMIMIMSWARFNSQQINTETNVCLSVCLSKISPPFPSFPLFLPFPCSFSVSFWPPFLDYAGLLILMSYILLFHISSIKIIIITNSTLTSLPGTHWQLNLAIPAFSITDENVKMKSGACREHWRTKKPKMIKSGQGRGAFVEGLIVKGNPFSITLEKLNHRRRRNRQQRTETIIVCVLFTETKVRFCMANINLWKERMKEEKRTTSNH